MIASRPAGRRTKTAHVGVEVSGGGRATSEGGALNVDVRLPQTAETMATSLRQKIIVGRLANVHPLPTEASPIKTFGVSRRALRGALRLLEADVLTVIPRRNQGGVSVREPKSHVAARYMCKHFGSDRR
jgi:DNA-binding FadR family transcriptional regulator